MEALQWETADELDLALAARVKKIRKRRSISQERLYKTFNADEYRYHENSETLVNRQHVANMKEMINSMLIVYCGLTEEDIEQLDGISEQELYQMFDSR